MNKKQTTSFNGNVLRLVSGAGLAQIITLAAAPILTRIYGAEVFGIAAIFAAITGIIIPLANLRYELAIVLPENDEEAANLLALSLTLTALIAVITTLILWSIGEPALNIINAKELLYFIWLIPASIFIGGVFSALNYWNTRTRSFTQISMARVLSQLTVTGGSLGLGFTGYANSGSLIIAGIVGQIVATLVLVINIIISGSNSLFSQINLRGMLASCKRYKNFPIFSSWGALLNAASWQIPVLMLGAFFSPAVVGLYSVGFRLIQMPMNLIGGAITQVFFQRGSEAELNGDLGRIVEEIFNKLLMIALLPSIIVMIIGADLFAFVFGEIWREAGVYVQILTPWVLVWFISSPLSSVYHILERQKDELKMHALIFIMRLVAISTGAYFYDARLAIILLSLAGLVSYGNLLHKIFDYSGVVILEIAKSCGREIKCTFIYLIPIVITKYIIVMSFIFQLVASAIALIVFVYLNRKRFSVGRA